MENLGVCHQNDTMRQSANNLPARHYIVIWQSLILRQYRSFFMHLAEIVAKKSGSSVSLIAPDKFIEGGSQKLTCEPFNEREKSAFRKIFVTPVFFLHIQVVWFRGVWKIFCLQTPIDHHQTPIDHHQTPIDHHQTPIDHHQKHHQTPRFVIICMAEPYSVTALGIYLAATIFLPRTFEFYLYTAQNIDKKFRWPMFAIQKFLIKRCKAVLACGQSQKTTLRQNFSEIRIIDFPLWFDETVFFPKSWVSDDKSSDDKSTEISNPDEYLTIGFAGSLLEEKGIRIFLKLIPHLLSEFPLLKFKIAGTGPLRSEVEKFCEENKFTSVDYIGAKSPGNMPDFFRALDILIVPSLTRPHWREQFGRVIVEALACGTTVLGSDSGEIPFVIDDPTCIFKENNLHDLSKTAIAKINFIAKNKNSIRTLNSNRALAKYSAKALAEKLASQLVFTDEL